MLSQLQSINVITGRGQPAVLHMVELPVKSGGTKHFVALAQLRECTASCFRISRSAFYRVAEDCCSCKRVEAPPLALAALKRAKAISVKASKCELVPLESAAEVLQSCGLPGCMMENILSQHNLCSKSNLNEVATPSGVSSTSDEELDFDFDYDFEEQQTSPANPLSFGAPQPTLGEFLTCEPGSMQVCQPSLSYLRDPWGDYTSFQGL